MQRIDNYLRFFTLPLLVEIKVRTELPKKKDLSNPGQKRLLNKDPSLWDNFTDTQGNFMNRWRICLNTSGS
jgi:hypothetical protein